MIKIKKQNNEVESFQFKFLKKNFLVPTIEAYKFSNKVMGSFCNPNNFVPLVLDINLSTPCNINCRYCYTSQGAQDRFEIPTNINKLKNSELVKIIKQFGGLGGKAIFLCSEGEPLYNPNYFLKFAEIAKKANVSLVTYTNGLTINQKVAKDLHDLDVNLVIKIESLKPQKNNYILGSDKFNYELINNKFISMHIPQLLEEYGADKSKLALSSMLTNLNIDELLLIREFSYKLGLSHFIKQLSWHGCAEENKTELLVSPKKISEFEKRLYLFDKIAGFEYPKNVSDEYSYDIRRFLNNYTNEGGFPARIFAHPRGGVYHNSDAVKTQFGFKKGYLVQIRDNKSNINLKNYFRIIKKRIKQDTK